jgi:hypothetical protein
MDPMTAGSSTVRYNHLFLGRQLRPNANLPVDVHRELGRLLKPVISATSGRSHVHEMIDMIRSELDEWAMRETTTQQLDQNEFNSLYYGGGVDELPFWMEVDEMIRRLEAVIDIVDRSYPACTPSKSLVGLARKAILSLETCDANGPLRHSGRKIPKTWRHS